MTQFGLPFTIAQAGGAAAGRPRAPLRDESEKEGCAGELLFCERGLAGPRSRCVLNLFLQTPMAPQPRAKY